MLESLKKYTGQFGKNFASAAKDIFKFENFTLLRQMMKRSTVASETSLSLECLCGDFICDNTGGAYTMKKFQEFLLPNSGLDLTKLICEMSTTSGLPSYTIGLGLGAIAGISYLGYSYYNRQHSTAKIPEEKVESKSPLPAPKITLLANPSP